VSVCTERERERERGRGAATEDITVGDRNKGISYKKGKMNILADGSVMFFLMELKCGKKICLRQVSPNRSNGIPYIA
jgi:hypothetical protein